MTAQLRTHQPGDTVQLAWQTQCDPWTITSRHGFIATCTRDSDGATSQFDVRDLHVTPRPQESAGLINGGAR